MEKVICVCKGNSDRSPLMAAVLKMYLSQSDFAENRGIVCSSAGILELASKGGPASSFAIAAAKRLGLNLHDHCKQQITREMVAEERKSAFFVCADEETAGHLVINLGAPIGSVVNAQVPNSWPCRRQEDFDHTAEQIMASMYRVLRTCFE